MGDALIMRKGGAGGSGNIVNSAEISVKSDVVIGKNEFVQLKRSFTSNKQTFGSSTAQNINCFKSGNRIIAFAKLSTNVCAIIYQIQNNQITYLNKITTNILGGSVDSFAVTAIDETHFLIFGNKSTVTRGRIVTLNDDNTLTYGNEQILTLTVPNYLFGVVKHGDYYYLMTAGSGNALYCVKLEVNTTISVIGETAITNYGVSQAIGVVSTIIFDNTIYVIINRGNGGVYGYKLNETLFSFSGGIIEGSAINGFGFIFEHKNKLYYVTKKSGASAYFIYCIVFDANFNVLSTSTGTFASTDYDDVIMIQYAPDVWLYDVSVYSYYEGTYRNIEGYQIIKVTDSGLKEGGFIHCDTTTGSGVYISNYVSILTQNQQIMTDPCVVVSATQNSSVTCYIITLTAYNIESDINGISKQMLTPSSLNKVIV